MNYKLRDDELIKLNRGNYSTPSDAYSQAALNALSNGTYRQLQKSLPSLKQNNIRDEGRFVNTENARRKYEQRINHNPEQSTTQNVNDDNYVVKRDRYEKLMLDNRLANDVKLLAEINHNNANQDATVSQEWADEYGAKKITGGMNKNQFISTLSRRYGLTPKELNDMALTFHSDALKLENEEYGKNLEEIGEKHPVIGSVGSLVGTLGSGVEGAYNTIAGGISGDDRYLSNMFRTTKNSPREGVKKNIQSDFGKGAYDVGMGIGDMAVGAAAGSAPVILAGNTANEALNSAINRGSSVREASAYGAVAGAVDYITNKIGLDKAKKLAVDSLKSTGLKRFLAQNAIAGAGEAGENIIQDIGQSLFDTLINGKNSELLLSFDDKKSKGMSDSDAFKEVAKEYMQQLGLSGAIGFGMGSAMQLGSSVKGKVPELVSDAVGKAKNAKIEDFFKGNQDVQDIVNGKLPEITSEADIQRAQSQQTDALENLQNIVEKLPALDNVANSTYNGAMTGGEDNVRLQTSNGNDGRRSEGILREDSVNRLLGSGVPASGVSGGEYLPSDRVSVSDNVTRNAKVFDDTDTKALTKANIPHNEYYDLQDADTFSRALTTAKANNPHGGAVDAHSVEDVQDILNRGGKTFLTADGTAGGAVDNGNLTAVFKDNLNNDTPRAASSIAIAGVKNGAVKGDCFGQFLVNSYSRAGFEPVGRVKYEYGFNEQMDNQVREQLAAGLISKEPDVYALKLIDGYDYKKSIENYGKAKKWTQQELDALPLYEGEDAYDRMLADRDAMIKQPKGAASSLEENIPDDRLTVDEMRQLGLDEETIRAQIEGPQKTASNNKPSAQNIAERYAKVMSDYDEKGYFDDEDIARMAAEVAEDISNGEDLTRHIETLEENIEDSDNVDVVVQMQMLVNELKALNGKSTDTNVKTPISNEQKVPNLRDFAETAQENPFPDVNSEEGGYNPETGEYELYETGRSGGIEDEPVFTYTETVEPGEGFVEDGKSRVVTNSAINGGVISRFDYDNDPVLQEIATYAKHNNDTTYANAFNNVKENGEKLLVEYNDGTRKIDNDQDVDQAMILLQNLTDQMRNGADDVKPQRDLLLSRLRRAGTQYGQFIQAFAKWNDTGDGLIINGERMQQPQVDAWKSTNQKAVRGNNKIAKALADMGNKWKQAAERPELTHEQVRDGVIRELDKEFGSVEQYFNDNDIEFLTILAENRDIPVWVITSEIEHKLNTGDWYSLDESTEIPKPTNNKLQSALNSLVEEQRAEVEPPTIEQITEEVRNTLDNEMAGVGDFTDEDVNYLANLINDGATKQELADALNTKMATGRFGISEDTQNKVNQLFEYANHYDPESREAVEAKSAAYQLVANEVVGDATPLEKFEAWRYLAMLGNPKTMIRNWVGNQMFGAVTGVSNNLSAVLEAGLDKASKKVRGKGIQRTKSVLNPAKDSGLISAAGKDAEVSRYATLSGEGKYEKGTRDAISRQKSVFNSKLVRLYEKMTDAGISDYKAVKRKYATSLAGYMKANGLNEKAFEADNTYKGLRDLSRKRVLSDTERAKMESLEDLHTALEKARDYAVKQAEYATFHEDNAIASFLTQTSQKARSGKLKINGKEYNSPAMKALGYMMEGLVPFKKTPANILRSGVEYSPLGAIDSIRKTGKLIYENTGSRKGNLADTYTKKSKLTGSEKTVDKSLVSDVLDSWSKTLTGSGLLALGYYLKNKGILNSSDKDKKYQDDLEGIQNYSMTINGKTYTIDWAAPAVMPMLVGAEISKIAERNAIPDQKWYGNIDSVINSVNALLDPLFETSMMQGVKNTLESAANEVKYNDEGAIGGILGSMATTMGTSYATQALPTLSGQIARTVDPTRRSNDTASDSNFLSGVEKQGRKLLNKIPGLSYLNEEYRDAYGRTQNNSPYNNPLANLAYQMMSPAYISEINTTKADEAARKAFDTSKDKSSDAFATWKGKVTVDGVKLSPKQMATYREKSGQENYKIREALANEKWFNELSGDRQSEILKNVNTLVDKIGKEAAGFEQDNKDLDIYKEGGIPSLLDKYQDKQINKQIEEQTGASSSSNVAKELKEAIKSGDEKAIKQKTDDAKKYVDDKKKADALGLKVDTYRKKEAEKPGSAAQYAETKKSADDLGIKQESYDKIVNQTGANADKVLKAVPELNRNGLKSTNVYLTYGNALSEIPSLSTADFVKTFNAVDADHKKGLSQQEVFNYMDSHEVENPQQFFNAYILPENRTNKKGMKKKVVQKNGKWSGVYK